MKSYLSRGDLYEDVPGFGSVNFSQHAINRAVHLGITEAQIKDVLFFGTETPDGIGIKLLEKAGIRMVVMVRPDKSAALVKTIYRIRPAKAAR